MADKVKSKEVLSDLVEGTRKFISRLREDVDELSTKGKYRLEIISLKNRRAKAFRDLGMRAYVLMKNGKYDIPEVKNLFAEIGALEKELRAQEKALEEYQASLQGKQKGPKRPGEKKAAAERREP